MLINEQDFIGMNYKKVKLFASLKGYMDLVEVENGISNFYNKESYYEYSVDGTSNSYPHFTFYYNTESEFVTSVEYYETEQEFNQRR